MEDVKGKMITALGSAMQPDIDNWASSDTHVVTFDRKPIGAIWSFHDLGVTPTECNTISVVCEGGYFRIKYNAATKYIITKHGDIFYLGHTVGSRIVSDSAIHKALETTFSMPDSTECIFRNEILNTIRDWVKTHMNGANWQTNGIEFGITKAGFRLSTIAIITAINNPLARCVRINESILAIWSGNEWISNDPLKGNVCTRGLSIHEVGCLRDVIVNIKPEQKPDSTDEQLLDSLNVKSFDELFKPPSVETIKLTPVTSTMLTTGDVDMYKQITADLKSLANSMEQPIITAVQKTDRNRQMLHRIKPIICKWLKDIVYSAGPFSSFEEVSATESASLKYSFIIHGDRDTNISMEMPYGFIGTMFVSHDGVKIMRIGPDDVVLLLPLHNIDPDIQINRLHNLLYEVLNIKQKRSKLDEIIKCVTFFIRATWPDIQYSICGRHIYIIKRSAGSDAPVGVIRFGFSYKPGYQLAILQDNDYDHPLIEFDDNWKPMLDSQDKFARKMYSWLSVNFGCEEEDPRIISDSLAKSLRRSDKVIPIRFAPMTHNFKSWASIRFAEAANLKAMPEDAGVYMDIAMEIIKERNNMIKIPGIKNVLFNDTKQTTTVLFEDGTITMSKTMDGETYDHEVGFAMCIMKKMYGNRTRFQKEIKRWTSVCENANKKIADKAAKKQEKNEEDVVS